MQNNESARDKLKQKLKAERMKRSSADSQRAFLEKKKVPADLVDTCMDQLQNKSKAKPSLQTIQSLLGKISTMVAEAKEAKEHKSE